MPNSVFNMDSTQIQKKTLLLLGRVGTMFQISPAPGRVMEPSKLSSQAFEEPAGLEGVHISEFVVVEKAECEQNSVVIVVIPSLPPLKHKRSRRKTPLLNLVFCKY